MTVASGPFPPDAPALGSIAPLDTVGHRIMNAVYRNGSIWATHAIESDGRSAARWYQIDAASLTVVQQGTVADPTLYFFFQLQGEVQVNVCHLYKIHTGIGVTLRQQGCEILRVLIVDQDIDRDPGMPMGYSTGVLEIAKV